MAGAPSYPFNSALVTGASSGIGEELTRQLTAAGVTVVVVARRADRLQALADELPGVEVLTADLATRKGQDAVATRIADLDRPIELVVNNAGFGTGGPFTDADPDRLDDEITVNIAALTRLSHAALGVMVPRGKGWLLNVASVAAFAPGPGLAVYAATKAYVLSLSESLHEEVRGTDVEVTALCPGLIRTEFQAVSNTERYERSIPSFVWLDVGDVVREALAATVKGRAISVPGAIYKTSTWVGGVTPRWAKRLASNFIPRD
jgi:short-subunit dehydrogenase